MKARKRTAKGLGSITTMHGLLTALMLLLPTAIAQPASPETIRVTAIPGIPLPVVVAKERGIFARYGLDVIAETASNSEVLRANLAEQKADIAHAAVDNAVAMPEGSVVIVMGGESSLNELMAQPEIHSLEELRGKTLIVDAPNTAFAIQLKKILLDKRLHAGRDYEIKPVGTTPQRLEAMRQHKEYAASMLGPPTSLLAKQQGFVSLASTQRAIGPYQSTGAFVRRGWAHDHHDAIVGYIAAYIEAERWLLDATNQHEVTALLMKQWHLSNDIAEKAYGLLKSGTWLQPDARFDPEAFSNVLKLRVEIEHQWNGTVPATQKYYDPAYYLQALERSER